MSANKSKAIFGPGGTNLERCDKSNRDVQSIALERLDNDDLLNMYLSKEQWPRIEQLVQVFPTELVVGHENKAACPIHSDVG